MRYLFFTTLLVVSPIPIFAATLELMAHEEPRAGETVLITVMLDTANENVNAIEGTLTIPENLELREIRDGNSLVSLWAERPHEVDGAIRFAGVTPGGYNGSGRELFSLLVDVQGTGTSQFLLTAARAYRNDGDGSELPLTLTPRVEVGGAPYDATDLVPPEAFTILRGNDESLFGGRPFVVFATQDKRSGIDHYEVARSWFPLGPLRKFLNWERVESPLEVGRDAYVYVRAIDSAGNERTATLSPDSVLGRAIGLGLAGILFLLAVTVLLYAYRRFRH